MNTSNQNMENVDVPKLRFPGFIESWEEKTTEQLMDRVSELVNVKGEEIYKEVGIRSHGKGLFHKKPVSGKSLGNKRIFWIKEDLFILNIVFAWEQAVGKTTSSEIGMVASHRFPMFKPKEELLDLDFILRYFLTKKGKHLLNLASPGGAGRNKTLGQQSFNKLKFLLPSLSEQQKIVAFLSLVDQLIENLKYQQSSLEAYKKGVVQKIFTQQIRFKDENGNDFPDWEEKNLAALADRIIEKNKEGNKNVLTISAVDGLINQEEYFNKSIASKNLSGYYTIHNGDFAYNKSYSKGYPMGAIKKLNRYEKGIVSPLYICFRIKKENSADFFEQLFDAGLLNNEIKKIAQEGARNHGLLNVSVIEFFENIFLQFPSLKEQQKIAEFLSSFDNLTQAKQLEIKLLETWKKGLMQQMFV